MLILPCASNGEIVLVRLGDHPGVIGELAFNQLGHQFDVGKLDFQLIRGNLQRDQIVGIFQQTLQLHDGLARNNDLMADELLIGNDLTEGKPMSIGGNRDHIFAIDYQEQAIEVIANVLLSH